MIRWVRKTNSRAHTMINRSWSRVCIDASIEGVRYLTEFVSRCTTPGRLIFRPLDSVSSNGSSRWNRFVVDTTYRWVLFASLCQMLSSVKFYRLLILFYQIINIFKNLDIVLFVLFEIVFFSSYQIFNELPFCLFWLFSYLENDLFRIILIHRCRFLQKWIKNLLI